MRIRNSQKDLPHPHLTHPQTKSNRPGLLVSSYVTPCLTMSYTLVNQLNVLKEKESE